MSVIAGRLNGIHAPEGSILGPTWTSELVAVDSNDEIGIVLRYATEADLERVIDDPQTVAEFRRNQMIQKPITDRLRELFGG